MPPAGRKASRRTAPRTRRCKYVSPEGERCRRIATLQGELCQTCARVLEAEILPDVWNDLATGQISLGDLISSAASSFVGKIFGSSPIFQDLNEAAQQAARQAQAAQARAQAQQTRPHAGSPPGSASRPGSSAGSQQQRPPPRPAGPDPKVLRAAFTTLGIDPRSRPTEAMISDRRKQLARIYHPDRPGGSTAQMQRINAAADLLIEHLGKSR